MKLRKILSLMLVLTICLAVPSVAADAKKDAGGLNGEALSEITGTAGDFSLSYESESAMLADMTLVAENSAYELYYHPASLAVGVKSKADGKVYLTNPYNAAKDPYYSGEVAEGLDSQLVISYIDAENVINTFYSSTDSVKLGQYNVKLYENGLCVDYSIGEEKEQLICPELFTKKDLDALLAKMDESDSSKLEFYYSLIDVSELNEEAAKEYTSKYPIAKKEPVYVLTELNSREQKNLDAALRAVGYDEKQYQADLREYGLSAESNASANIKLSLNYILTEEGLTVNIPRESIAFDSEVCYLQSVDLLPYFGADSEATGDSGYLFIPDGSGAIINFAGQTDTRRRIMTSRVYGYDGALDLKNYKNEGKQYYLPVYGIVRNNSSAVFAIIEQGDALSEITARLGAPNSNYYSVYNTFLYTTVEKVRMDAKVSSMNSAQDVYLYDENIGNTDFTVSYRFLSGDKANYSEMAAIYRNKLMADGMTEKDISLKLEIETIGSALYEDSFLGFTYNREAELTKYSDNTKILEYFKEQDIPDISLSLLGWQKYGMDSSLNNKLRFSGTLGGKGDFKDLLKYCADGNTEIYLNADITGVKYNRLFDGFSKSRDTAKRMDRDYANLSNYDAATQMFDDEGFLVSPLRYNKILEKLFKSSDKYSATSLNLTKLGTQLNSDFDSDKSVNRHETMAGLKETLKAAAKNYSLGFEGANAYVLTSASKLTAVPMVSSKYPGETASVPFVQMVVGGCIKCVSEPINLSGEKQTTLLNCIMTGTSPGYTLVYGNVELLKSTDYTEYYAVSFETLKESVAEGYKYVSKALESTEGSRLVKHTAIADGVSLSEFENGAGIYVNTTNSDYAVGAITVPAAGYAVR